MIHACPGAGPEITPARRPSARGRALLCAGAFAIGLWSGGLGVRAQATEEEAPDTFEMLDLFGEAFERVRRDYVEDVADDELIEAAIQGMLRNLDPHSAYMDRRHFEDMQTNTRGEFGGLGIEVTMDESGYVRVVSPIDDTPAYRAGLQAGDLITHLDGEPIQGLTLNDAIEQMRGEIGSDITLTVARVGEEPFDVTITRDNIRIRSVRSRVEGDIGYIRITSFNAQTQKGLETALEDIRDEIGDNPKGYVLDLRNNPGGLLDQAISVTDTFLTRGEIVSTRSRDPENIQRYQATKGDMTDGLPIVVLINGGSASASEIVAGALQDHNRAILMGTRTFGKGSVQTIMPLSRAGAAIKLTTQRYYTPSGQSIQAKGITPDIEVARARLELIDSGESRSESDFRNALDKENADADDTGGESEQDADGDQSGESGESGAANETDGMDDAEIEEAERRAREDYQLARALDLLRGINLFRNRMVTN